MFSSYANIFYYKLNCPTFHFKSHFNLFKLLQLDCNWNYGSGEELKKQEVHGPHRLLKKGVRRR